MKTSRVRVYDYIERLSMAGERSRAAHTAVLGPSGFVICMIQPLLRAETSDALLDQCAYRYRHLVAEQTMSKLYQ